MEKNKTIVIVAGEASGDLHASNLVKSIKEIYPAVEFFGLGGAHLKKEGVNLYFNIVDLAVVGFFEVLKNLIKFRKIFNGLLSQIDRIKPDLAVLVDYPGFNLRLAEELKKRNIPIIYYISPQVWAWGKNRIKAIKRNINRMIVVFRFEEELYKRYNIPVSFVGHPLLDIVKNEVSKEELFNKLGISSKQRTFAILPGSREKEVKNILPIMLESARLIYNKIQDSQFLILRSSTVKEEIFNTMLAHYNLPIYMLQDKTYEGLSVSDFALVASGTATLETAILQVPLVIIYKVSLLTFAYIRMMISIPYIGLVNVIKQRKIVAEFIQFNAKPKKIADYVTGIINDPLKIKRIKEDLSTIKDSLGEKGASQKAGRIIVDFLRQ